ncbi:DUF3426 domain-containing protein [Solemya velesiana gill symbiont]|uniref:DUF3426 domain-containing protein n=1 Tax=Solemya velesiana gill symbiont TaxID=1918948 RepID=A0A1T2KY68_9GAMM|nr:DUF3426 domain-containing protein [Solemya velesiana gill symbiont]OOZ37807.1 hypothetical protein BOW51_00645 [Solemya velesiana gill symbiont]
MTDSLSRLLEELQTDSFAPHDEVAVNSPPTPDTDTTPHAQPLNGDEPTAETPTVFSGYLAELGDEESEETGSTRDQEPRFDAFTLYDQDEHLAIPSLDSEQENTTDSPGHSQLSFHILEDGQESAEPSAEQLPWASEWNQECETAPEEEPDDGFTSIYSGLDADSEEIDAAYLEQEDQATFDEPEKNLEQEPDASPQFAVEEAAPPPADEPQETDALYSGQQGETVSEEENLYGEPDSTHPQFALEEAATSSMVELPEPEPPYSEPHDEASPEEEEGFYDEPDTIPSHFALNETEMTSSGDTEEPDTAALPEAIEEAEQTLPFSVPDNLPDIEPSESSPPDLDELVAVKRKRNKGTVGWAAVIILLVLVAQFQLAWFGREHLASYPGMLNVVEQFCDFAGCELKPKHEPGKFKVISRMMASHPQQENALILLMNFTNQARHPQPYPRLQLSLYDINENLTARRLFSPDEYMGRKIDRSEVIAAGGNVSIELPLEDPGSSVTGFQFDFF